MHSSTNPALLLAVAFALLGSSWAAPPTGLTPRELFYATPAPAPATPKSASASKKKRPAESPVKEAAAGVSKPAEAAPARPLGLRYSILKYAADGSSEEVDSESVFRTGDLIRLRIRVNEPAHLYVAHKGSTGAWRMLFPSAEHEKGDNAVHPGREYDLPGRTRLIFDETPGEERIFLILSRQPDLQIDRMIYDLDRVTEPGESKPSKTLVAQARIPDETVGRAKLAARDLVFEKVDSSRPAPAQAGGRLETAVYVVNASRTRDARLVADITLKHR